MVPFLPTGLGEWLVRAYYKGLNRRVRLRPGNQAPHLVGVSLVAYHTPRVVSHRHRAWRHWSGRSTQEV